MRPRRVPLAARRAVFSDADSSDAAVAALRFGALQERTAVAALADARPRRAIGRRVRRRAEERAGAGAEERVLRVAHDFHQIAAERLAEGLSLGNAHWQLR